MSYSDGNIWFIIIALGIGTFLIRFSFLGLIGARDLPEWILRHLRYTPVGIGHFQATTSIDLDAEPFGIFDLVIDTPVQLDHSKYCFRCFITNAK